MNNQQEKNKQGKTLIVNPILHKALSQIKLDNGFKSVDEVISKLLESHRKLNKK